MNYTIEGEYFDRFPYAPYVPPGTVRPASHNDRRVLGRRGVQRFSPLIHDHINLLGRYHFTNPDQDDALDRRGLGNTGGVSAPLPSWPSTPPSHGSVVRAFTDDDVPLAVELGDDPYVGLGLRELSEGRATAGFSVAPRHRGRGVASSATTALLSFAWTIPALHRVELYIEPWNTSSLRVADASGFQREGLLRSHQETGGRRRDMLLFAATRD